MATSFDELSSDEQGSARDSRPVWAVGWDNDDAIHKWLKGDIAFLQKESEEFIRNVRKNIALYRGIQYETQESRQSLRDREADRSRAVKRIVVNHLYDLTENLVSMQVKYKPAILVLPTTDDQGDKLSAKVVKMLLDHIWYEKRFEDEVYPKLVRVAKIMREAYLWITWNPDLGDAHPDAKPGEQIPLMDSNGKPELDENDQEVMVDADVRVGEVDYEVVLPDQVFPQNKKSFTESDYVYRRRVIHTEELRLKYPKAGDKIKVSRGAYDWDYEKLQERKIDNETVYWEFHHRKTKGCPKGRTIVFTDDGLLENGELGYSDGDLPCERLTDIDVPGELRGESFYNNVKMLTGIYNNMTNMANKAMVFASQSKWMMPAGTAKLESLGNDHTIVQFKGPIAPQLVTPNPLSPVIFAFRKELKEEFQQISGVFGVSRGEPPAGIKAGVALQFLSAQEQERQNASILKASNFIKRVGQKTISRAADNYDEADARTIRILGKDNDYSIVKFDHGALVKKYDFRCQNSSALPQDKAARTQTILDLSERFPGAFPEDNVLEMLDMAQDQKFMTEGSAAARKAEAENEKILDGEEKVPPPMASDNQIVHWRTHLIKLQEYAVASKSDPVKVKELEDHVAAHEMMMTDMAMKNPMFAQKLMALDQFPVFYVPTPQVPQAIPGQPPGPGMAQAGVPAPLPAGPGGVEGAQGRPVAAMPELPVNPGGPSVGQGLPTQIPENPGPVGP